VREGDGLVIDMGVIVDGYCSDLTRTIVVGKASDQFKKIYDIVLSAQMTAYELVRPGMKGSEAHGIAQKVIDEAGYGDRFGHGLGHGIGLQVHEAPGVGRLSENVLEEGMVFTLEPGIYLPDWGGIRIEDNVILENGRARLLSHAPKLDLMAA
jgi:Xaa-Pro aminopeptidase